MIFTPRILRPCCRSSLKKPIAAALNCGAHDERVPPRKRVVAVKVQRGIEKFPTRLDMPKRLDQPVVDGDGFIRGERNCCFREHYVEPFLHHLIAEKSIARFVSRRDPFLCNGLFAGFRWINRVDQQVRVEKELIAHCARRG